MIRVPLWLKAAHPLPCTVSSLCFAKKSLGKTDRNSKTLHCPTRSLQLASLFVHCLCSLHIFEQRACWKSSSDSAANPWPASKPMGWKTQMRHLHITSCAYICQQDCSTFYCRLRYIYHFLSLFIEWHQFTSLEYWQKNNLKWYYCYHSWMWWSILRSKDTNLRVTSINESKLIFNWLKSTGKKHLVRLLLQHILARRAIWGEAGKENKRDCTLIIKLHWLHSNSNFYRWKIIKVTEPW